MNTENPYLPPSVEFNSPQTLFSVEGLPIVLRTPRAVMMLSGMFSFLFAVLAAASIFAVVYFGTSAVLAIALAVIFAFGSFAYGTAFFTTVTINHQGIAMRGLRDCSYEWNAIESWQQNELGKGVSFVGIDGKSIFVSNFAVTSKSHSAAIVEAFSHFLGPQRKTNVG